MKKVGFYALLVINNLPLIKEYAVKVINFIDMLDGVKDWNKKPESVAEQQEQQSEKV